MRNITYRDALREALREEMLRDDAVFLLGEDIAQFGGSFKVTKGLFEEFGPTRVRNTPISEAAIAGAALGAALVGMRPVAEIMFIDFITLAMDQIVNQIAKVRYMFGGKARASLVIRTQGGGGVSSGGQHAQSLEAWFCHIPGLVVVMPSTPYDAKGLMKASIHNDNPVIFIEHKVLYNEKGPVPDEEYLVPLGKGDIKRQGTDITIITYSRMTYFCLEAALQLEKEGIEAEIIDLRTLKPLDFDLIATSIQKTSHALVVHESCLTGGFGSEIAARIGEELFDYLDAPAMRIGAKDVPIPFSPVLENYVLPQVEDIVEGAKRVLNR